MSGAMQERGSSVRRVTGHWLIWSFCEILLFKEVWLCLTEIPVMVSLDCQCDQIWHELRQVCDGVSRED